MSRSGHLGQEVGGGNSNPTPIKDILAAYPDLARLTDSAWRNAVQNAVHQRFRARSVLLRGAAPVSQFLLIIEGSIRVYYPADDGREITLYRVQPGDLCILSLNSLYDNRYFNIAVQACTDVYALAISETDFRAALANSDAFRNYVLSTLNGRLCDLMFLVQDTAFNNLNARLACLLGRLFERAKSSTIRVTHHELALELGTTREVVSRILKDFEQQAYIRLARGRIVLNGDGSLFGAGKTT